MHRRRIPKSAGRPLSASVDSSLAPEGREEPIEVARYIAQLTAEMTRLASAAQLDLLAYLLAMAQSEADAAARASKTLGAD